MSESHEEQLTWEDRMAIVDLAHRYNHAVDHRRGDDLAGLFTEDGRIEVNGKTLCEGRQGLLDYIESARAKPARRRHWIGNPVVDGSERSARLRLYVTCYDITEGRAGAPYVLGEYNDDVVRQAGGWRFSIRRMTSVAGSSAIPSPPPAAA